ncbi:zinc finger CCCH domain-containing protein 3 [Lampris incognitus]|uniref:zinc finger CCCH domain-containing protein 3 n=1 Tax=Lampris incognitus TaxID=2546036 RepID=UPI0024B523B9|nr:zinc finger CCCH domain-containing protein 3 [Lampris incognitus]
MEEKEALKRQIELLQNLINNHKSVHGNNPSVSVDQWRPARSPPARGRGQSTSFVCPQSSRGGSYASQQHRKWKKTYSLSNRVPQPSARQPLASTSSSDPLSTSVKTTYTIHGASLLSQNTKSPARGDSGWTETDTLSSEIAVGGKEGQIGMISKDKPSTDVLRKTVRKINESSLEDRNRDSVLTGAGVPQDDSYRKIRDFQQRADGMHKVPSGKKDSGSSNLPSSVKTNSFTRTQRISQLQIKPHLPEKNIFETKQAITMAMSANIIDGNSNPSVSALPSPLQPQHVSSMSQPSLAQGTACLLKKSKFTWVKTQDTGTLAPRQTRSIPRSPGSIVAPTLVSNAAIGGPATTIINRRTPSKKLPRRLSIVTGAPKTSKYTWVSSSAGGQVKLTGKPLSPKGLALAHRALEKGKAAMKLKQANIPKTRKAIACSSSTTISVSSRYRWKAGQSVSAAVAQGSTLASNGSAFNWTSEKSCRGVKGGLGVRPSSSTDFPIQPSSSPGGFKLHSRMKIIRRSASSGSASERRVGPPAVMVSGRHLIRGRTHTLTKSPVGMRKAMSKELVSFGRHRLRRLSPGSSRAGHATPSHRSPTSPRVFRTRYKMVTRRSASVPHAFQYSPTLSWRAKRIQSARSVLQNRVRVPQDRQSPSHHWRARSMRWIGGSLYRVSANKLSRTVAPSMSINRTGRWLTPQQTSPTTSTLSRPSNTRHVASRVVQRSLAIIRQAHQKKQPRQYCMYYNRFGKCNRGSSCPYIHDPDKVAVCTRFLRGTCKKADGTCPFSHKVAKEKMPVCSYFLKGICDNSNCPYSHVYVSRKAAMCQDFIKGYCPQGEKCKKKHTLVCPDFSSTGTCPRGSRCKLQHRQKAKRSAPTTSAMPTKRARTKDSTKRPRLSIIMPPKQAQDSQADPVTPTSGSLKLPSFISLSSSPEEAEIPDTPPAETSQVKEKKLQIKPRL